MKYLKKKKKSPLLPIVLILAVAIVAGVLALTLWPAGAEADPTEPPAQSQSADVTESGVQTEHEEPTEPQTPDGTEAPTELEEVKQEETEAPGQETLPPPIPEETVLPDCEVETPYGTLYFPGRWKDTMWAEVETLDFGADVVFYGTVAGEECWLFTVHYGGADGIGIGAVMTKEEYLLDVTVEMSDFVPTESWSQADTDLFSAMQETMNYLMEKLKEDPAFQA